MSDSQLLIFFHLINATTRLHVQIIYTTYQKTFSLQVITLCTLTTSYVYITKQNYTYLFIYFFYERESTRLRLVDYSLIENEG